VRRGSAKDVGVTETQQSRNTGDRAAAVHQAVHRVRCRPVRTRSPGKFLSTTPNKVIYSMIGVSKFYDKKAVLKDIYLSYFYGAKIGVIGLNGSGKSSLLRILAGVDQEFQGKTAVSPGFTIGFLEQEPQLDASKTVREIVEQGVQPIVDLLREFDEINAKFGEP